jgi:hypothetical protein
MSRYEKGDYIKVGFKNAEDPIGEWMWVRVESSDDNQHLVFGVLNNESVSDHSGRLHHGSQIAVSCDKIREHRKPTEFRAIQ